MTVFLLFFSLFVGDASAVRLAMDAQNRAFVGGSWIDGGYGPSLGIESRLTQLIYINMGGFRTITPPLGDTDSDSEQDWVTMRHAIWAAPGWRIPHRYKENSINWDIIARGGFACVFSSDAHFANNFLVDPAGLVGVDLYLHNQKFGVRSSTKLFMYQATLSKNLTGINVNRVQSSIELYLQWD